MRSVSCRCDVATVAGEGIHGNPWGEPGGGRRRGWTLDSYVFISVLTSVQSWHNTQRALCWMRRSLTEAKVFVVSQIGEGSHGLWGRGSSWSCLRQTPREQWPPLCRQLVHWWNKLLIAFKLITSVHILYSVWIWGGGEYSTYHKIYSLCEFSHKSRLSPGYKAPNRLTTSNLADTFEFQIKDVMS